MSIVKITCPNLSELTDSLGYIEGVNSKKPVKPLCDNIFDVQRSELYEVLEQLRSAFWSDQESMPQHEQPTIPPEPQPTHSEQPLEPSTNSLKRASFEFDDDSVYQEENEASSPKKRLRVDSPSLASPMSFIQTKLINTSNTPSTSNTLLAYTSLWPLKQSVIRQIKSASYKETDVLTALTNVYQTKSNDQCRHLSLYWLPFAKAMRRQAIIDTLNQWILIKKEDTYL